MEWWLWRFLCAFCAILTNMHVASRCLARPPDLRIAFGAILNRKRARWKHKRHLGSLRNVINQPKPWIVIFGVPSASTLLGPLVVACMDDCEDRTRDSLSRCRALSSSDVGLAGGATVRRGGDSEFFKRGKVEVIR